MVHSAFNDRHIRLGHCHRTSHRCQRHGLPFALADHAHQHTLVFQAYDSCPIIVRDIRIRINTALRQIIEVVTIRAGDVRADLAAFAVELVALAQVR